ncbi:unnamed protein product [Linum trigynum]|uniref:Uncharacterized protein n=1 Tax=Linum trigynum TaxID=586398 RepID=A0AAV2EB21_9ROSI
MYALLTMFDALDHIHLGSIMTISFFRVKGHLKAITLHGEPYITRVSRGHTRDFFDETLYSMGLIRVARTNPRVCWLKGLPPEEFAEAAEAEAPAAGRVPPHQPKPNSLQFFPCSSSAVPPDERCAAIEAPCNRIEAHMDHECDARYYSHILLEGMCSTADVDTTQTFCHPYPARDAHEED